MSRDLYGEVLANVLNRKAPPNHFAAYINPDEAAMLRSQGGGVAPGGGQYMANGMPSFQVEGVGGGEWGADWGGYGSEPGEGVGLAGDGGSVDAAALAEALQDNRSWEQAVQDITVANMANQLDPTVGLSPGVNPFGTVEARAAPSMPSVDSAAVADMIQDMEREQARADNARRGMAIATAVQAPGPAVPSSSAEAVDRSFATGTPSYGPQEEPGVWGEGEGSVGTAWEGAPGTWTGYENALANQKANQERLGKGYKTNLTVRQADQLAIINSNPDLTSEQRTEMFSRPISQGGTGQYSPATMLSGQGAPAGVIAHVMTPSASGGYAVNDPGSDVSVPKGYNMGFVPAAMTSLIGLASPLASLMTLPGYGLTDYAVDLAKEDEGFIGGAYNTFSNMRDKMADAFSPVTSAFGDLTGAVRDRVVDFGGGLGDALSNFDSPFPDSDPPRPEAGTPGQSAADPGPDIAPINEFVNVADDSFSVTDGVVQNPGEKEKEYSPIPPDILARILANVQYGRERQRIARKTG